MTDPGPAAAGPAPPVTGAERPELSRSALASLVLGFFFLLFPAAIAAIILGHLSRSKIRESGGRLRGAGMALAGLVMGYLGLALVVLFLLVALSIPPGAVGGRRRANEAGAVASIRTINAAEYVFAANNSAIGFTCNLEQLGPDRKSTRLNSSHLKLSRMPSSA